MKIALINNNTSGIWHFRRELIMALVANGHEVFLLTPVEWMIDEKEVIDELESLGAKHIPIPLDRFSGMYKDFKLLFSLYKILKKIKPDMVHTMTIKPNIYGAIAAKWAGVKTIVGLVCGTGRAFADANGFKEKLRNFLVCLAYRQGVRRMDRVWFLNAEDREQFVKMKITPENKTVLIKSEGVNLSKYSSVKVQPGDVARLREQLGISEETMIVLMIARATWSKGVKQFYEASQQAINWDQKVKFVLVGWLALDDPDGVPEKYLEATSNFLFLGPRSDIPELITLSDIVTLPSYYREGTPRVLLEAMALSRPIVTTDNNGCRDTVDANQSGILVPVRDSAALTAAIKRLVEDKATREKFAKNGLTKVQNEFSVEIIIERVFRELYQFENFTLPDFSLIK